MSNKNSLAFVKFVTGGAEITLHSPLEIDGAKVSVLKMRENKVRDNLAVQRMKADEAEKEVALFANLCELTPEDIGNLGQRDYDRLTAAFMGFRD